MADNRYSDATRKDSDMLESYFEGKKSSSWATNYRSDCSIIMWPIDKDVIAPNEVLQPQLYFGIYINANSALSYSHSWISSRLENPN